MRIVSQPPGRIADPDALQAVEDFSARRFFTHPAMQGEHFVQLFFQGMQRIKRNHRLLEDHRDAVTAHAAQGALIRVQQRLTVKADIAGGIADRRRREQPQHR